MGLCLKYFWVEKYGCLVNTGFQFDDKFEFTYDTKRNALNIKPIDMKLKNDFWEPTGRLANIHAIIGDNGYGKTTSLWAFIDAFSQIYPSNGYSSEEYIKSNAIYKALMVVENKEEQRYQALCIGTKVKKSHSGLLDLQIISDKLQIRNILCKVKVAYFANNFDFRDYSVPKANHISAPELFMNIFICS